MATLQDFRDERLRKLNELKTLGINPYPAKAHRTHDIETVHLQFNELENQTVTTLGRIKSIRKFGKLAFVVIQDDGGMTLQLFIRHDENAAAPDRSNSELVVPAELTLLDTGDFVEATGPVIKTQTGEISVDVRNLRIISKALRDRKSVV